MDVVYILIYVFLVLGVVNWGIGRDYDSVMFLNAKLGLDEMTNIFWDSVPIWTILAISLLAGYVRMVGKCW